MGEIYNQLKAYFKSTPKEQLDKDCKEIKPWNEIGPDVEEWVMESYKKRYKKKRR